MGLVAFLLVNFIISILFSPLITIFIVSALPPNVSKRAFALFASFLPSFGVKYGDAAVKNEPQLFCAVCAERLTRRFLWGHFGKVDTNGKKDGNEIAYRYPLPSLLSALSGTFLSFIYFSIRFINFNVIATFLRVFQAIQVIY